MEEVIRRDRETGQKRERLEAEETKERQIGKIETKDRDDRVGVRDKRRERRKGDPKSDPTGPGR